MKIVNKIILIAFIMPFILNASETLAKPIKTVSTASENVIQKTEKNINDVLNSNTHIFLSGDGTHDRSNCKIECPPLKDDYFGRISNFNLRNGSTQCYVYKKGTSTSLGTVTNRNNYCVELFKSKSIHIENKLKKDHILNKIKEYEKLYFENYTDTGEQKFVNVSKYMIAGLTADYEVIDIGKSLRNNDITVQSNYTLYPNAQVESSQGFLKDFYNDIKEFFGSTDSELDKNYELVSSVKSFMSNSILFVVRFLAEFDQTMLLAKSYILFTVLPFTIFFAVSSKITKFASGIKDYDDIVEKVLVGILTIFVFYFSTNKIIIDDELKISQTNFQNWFRPVMYKGVEIADEASQAVVKAFVKHKLSNAGVRSLEEMNSLHEEKSILEKELKYLVHEDKSFLQICHDTYNTEALKSQLGRMIGLNMTFPPSEDITRYSNILNSTTRTNFYSTGKYGFLKNEEDLYRTNLFSVSSCYQIERMVLTKKNQLKKIDLLIAQYDHSVKNKSLEKQIELLTKLEFRNTSEMGFISMPMLATTSIAIDNIGMFQANNNSNNEDVLNNFRQSGDYEIGGIAQGDGLIDAPVNLMLSNLPYLMLPMADGINQKLIQIIEKDNNGSSNGFISSILNKATGLLGVSKIVSLKNFFMDKINAIRENPFLVTLLASILTILIMVYIVSYLPLITVATASFAVIFFFFLSVEIYYIATPFIIAFAFTSNQLEIIKSILKTGLIFAFKPLLIVINIVLALFAIDFFDVINQAMINYQFEPIFALTEAIEIKGLSSLGTYAFADIGLVFIKGFLTMAISILGVAVSFYLVLNGANMILDMFGVRENSFDVQTSIGDKVDNKASQVNTPI